MLVKGKKKFFGPSTSIMMSAAGPVGIVYEPATAHSVTLSNGNLTATNTGTTSLDQGAHVPFTYARSAGKYYFEIQSTTLGTGGSYAMGIMQTTATYSGLGANATGGALSYMTTSPGNSTWVNGTIKIASFLTPANGSWYAIAVDLDHLTYWVKNATTAGQWNGSGSANPATNTGGFALPAASYVPVAIFGGASGTAGTVQTANFGPAGFVGAVPAGFNSGWV
jgi:hypothetical protein